MTRFLGIPLLAASALLFLPSAVTYAEKIIIPIGQQGQVEAKRPKLGMTMSGVNEAFGEPQHKGQATGTPPITRWDYESFTVYFEGDVVIHSVLKFTPKVANQP